MPPTATASTATETEEGTRLEFVVPHEDPNVNVFLYGPPKSGKTIGATSAPGPVLLVNADRPNATRYAHYLRGDSIAEVRPTGVITLQDVMREVRTGDYATVIVDTVADLYRIVLEDLSKMAVNPAINDRGDAGTYIERFLRDLCEQPINAVFVAHELLLDDESGVERTALVTSKSGSPAFANKIMGMVDVIGYCGSKLVEVEGEDEPQVQYLAQLYAAGGRLGADRFGVLGRSRQLNLSEWFGEIKTATAPKALKEEAK